LDVLKAAWDRGMYVCNTSLLCSLPIYFPRNTYDTANTYSNGESERVIGKFVEKVNLIHCSEWFVVSDPTSQNKIPRNQIIILTKCYNLVRGFEGSMHDGQYETLGKTREYVNNRGLSRAAVFNAVSDSLERLNTTYIDLLQIHRFDPDVPVEETMKALHDLVESGKVRYIGASSMRTWQFALMNEVAERRGWTKFASMQNQYSLLYREEVDIPLFIDSLPNLISYIQEREMLPYCAFNGIGVIPWGPVGGGLLTRPVGETTARAKTRNRPDPKDWYSEADRDIVNRVEEVAKQTGKSMAQVALAWVVGKVSNAIIGLSSVKRIEESLIDGFELTKEQISYLEEPYVHPFSCR